MQNMTSTLEQIIKNLKDLRSGQIDYEVILIFGDTVTNKKEYKDGTKRI